MNRAADGSSIRLADPGGGATEWNLVYEGLTDDEIAAIANFFALAEGRLNEFTFVDPAANLLAWSDDLGSAVWQKEPLLTASGGLADPMGGLNAWSLSNIGAGPQRLFQNLMAPGGYVYCFSAYLRAEIPAIVTILAGDQSRAESAGTNWKRVTFNGTGDASADSIAFGLELPAGGGVQVFGMQAEPQSGASGYKPSTIGGIYEGARLRDDILTITTTGVNRHSCTVNIVHANHL